jgi:hypothetical protein
VPRRAARACHQGMTPHRRPRRPATRYQARPALRGHRDPRSGPAAGTGPDYPVSRNRETPTERPRHHPAAAILTCAETGPSIPRISRDQRHAAAFGGIWLHAASSVSNEPLAA